MQSDQSLHCPPTELLDTIECINGKQRPRRDPVHMQDGHAQGDMNLHILRMLEGTFSLDAAQICKQHAKEQHYP